jgi:hypothetical protein
MYLQKRPDTRGGRRTTTTRSGCPNAGIRIVLYAIFRYRYRYRYRDPAPG